MQKSFVNAVVTSDAAEVPLRDLRHSVLPRHIHRLQLRNADLGEITVDLRAGWAVLARIRGANQQQETKIVGNTPASHY